MQKYICNIIILFCLYITGCSFKSTIQEIDSNGDGKTDIWTNTKDKTYVTSVDRNYDGKADNWYVWDQSGRLLKWEYFRKNQHDQKSVNFYKDHKQTFFKNQNVWRCELDLDRTFPSNLIASFPKTYIYTREFELVASEIDDNKDGIIDKQIELKNFHKI